MTKEAIPVEGDKEVFESMKKWLLSNRTTSWQGNILEIIRDSPDQVVIERIRLCLRIR